MVEMKIVLTTINDINNFVNSVSRYDFGIDLSSGRYIVDGKSIMGILSLDLSHPISLRAYTNDPAFAENMKPFAAAE